MSKRVADVTAKSTGDFVAMMGLIIKAR